MTNEELEARVAKLEKKVTLLSETMKQMCVAVATLTLMVSGTSKETRSLCLEYIAEKAEEKPQ